MATALLSIFNYVLRGFCAPYLGSLTISIGSSLFANPAYQNQPTNPHQFLVATPKLATTLRIQSLRMLARGCLATLPNHFLYLIDLCGDCCPERHFGGNQLPDSSIGLSPLYPGHTIELNVRTA